ncbi:anti-sigma factor [Moheibacter sediminis]|uniref:Anti-sigma-K factor rskA n=1 Tax=Moheibacter sediminis TaxID=1434700 RepID=A0A1W1ZMI6_9FLAO|nr:anti-sigma factor [Moheibacter sediminis]SMC49577.1 hypothetical protein SAMN06296427_10386 [Moheibacter sediminis]
MKKYLLIFISAMLLWSCEETDLLDETGILEITDFNLPAIEGYNYQGWLLVGGTYVSVGTFNIDSINNNRARFSNIETSDLALAEAFAITIENASSPAPSNYVLLVGDFDGNTANLVTNATTSNGVSSLGSKISASYTLQNATVPADQTDEYPGNNGIWFFKGSGAQAESTISLEYGEIRYQAWLSTILEGAPKYVNMGIITSDSIRDLSNIYTSYTTNIPDFAGEDFIVQPSGESFPQGFFPRKVTLPGTKVIITPIITGYANHTAPFPIFLLEGTIPEGATNDPNVTYNMELNTTYKAKATKL